MLISPFLHFYFLSIHSSSSFLRSLNLIRLFFMIMLQAIVINKSFDTHYPTHCLSLVFPFTSMHTMCVIVHSSTIHLFLTLSFSRFDRFILILIIHSTDSILMMHQQLFLVWMWHLKGIFDKRNCGELSTKCGEKGQFSARQFLFICTLNKCVIVFNHTIANKKELKIECWLNGENA